MASRDRRTIDDTRPKAEVYGMSGAAFEQDGVFYSSAGLEIFPEERQEPPEEEILPENPNDPNIGYTVVSSEPVVDLTPDGEPVVTDSTYAGMHHMKLRAMLKIYDVEWTDRDSAIAYLSGKKVAA